jgi:hypothetical protein
MPITLAEANKYSTNQVLIGVAEEIIKASPLLEFLPFTPVKGNAAQYLRELTIGAGTFFDPGDTWTEVTPTVTQVVTALKIVGSDADMDKFLATTRSKDQDLVSEVLTMKAKGIAHTIEDTAITGDIAVNAKAFDGLRKLISAFPAQEVSLGANGGTGSFSGLDQLVDLVKPRPDALLISRRSRRAISKLARAQGSELATAPGPGDIGRRIELYDGLPLLVSDFIVDTMTQGTSTDCTEIYALVFGPGGVEGLSATAESSDDLANIIQIEEVGTLETKDATRWRLKSYLALALRATVGLGRFYGIRATDWTN